MGSTSTFKIIWLLAGVLCIPAALSLSSLLIDPPGATDRLFQGAQWAVWLTPLLLMQWALLFVGWLRYGLPWWIAAAAMPGIASWALPSVLV